MQVEKLPFPKQLAYACGMLGWSTMINTITVMLIYFYLPPNDTGLISLIPQFTILGVLNAMSIIAAGGRLFDAITDPIIAHLSDKSANPKGRRIPFMKLGVIPALVCCILIFIPVHPFESNLNILWLAVLSIGFFLSLTIYIIPYNALLPELGHNSEEKLRLSTWQSVGFVAGMIISSQIPAIADFLQDLLHLTERRHAFQYAIAGVNGIAAVFMFIPVFQIDEHRYCLNIPSTTKLWTSLKSTFSNRNFRIFIVADFSYYMGIAIITNGLLYYVRVLLGLPEAFGGKMIALMVLVSLLFYPVVNWVAGKYGKKMPLVFSFLVMGLAMSTVYYLGEFPLSMKAQAYLLMVAVGLPLAFLSIIPPAILAEIAEIDSMRTGQKREGMFFAVRNFFMKMGQTLGMGCFAVLTLYGKDPGNDMGIRLNGILGLVLGIVAALVFLNFREKGYKRDFSRFLRK